MNFQFPVFGAVEFFIKKGDKFGCEFERQVSFLINFFAQGMNGEFEAILPKITAAVTNTMNYYGCDIVGLVLISSSIFVRIATNNESVL